MWIFPFCALHYSSSTACNHYSLVNRNSGDLLRPPTIQNCLTLYTYICFHESQKNAHLIHSEVWTARSHIATLCFASANPFGETAGAHHFEVPFHSNTTLYNAWATLVKRVQDDTHVYKRTEAPSYPRPYVSRAKQ